MGHRERSTAGVPSLCYWQIEVRWGVGSSTDVSLLFSEKQLKRAFCAYSRAGGDPSSPILFNN